MIPSTPKPTCMVFMLISLVTASDHAQITAPAQLIPRQSSSDPAFVGYISSSNGYSNARTCDYPQTLSTSGAYIQCCPTSGSCPFFTSCSGNTLLATEASVPCDVNTALTCNTGIVLSTIGANGGGSYLACWQKSIGQSPFTFVQNIGSASATMTGSGAAASSSRSSSSVSRTSAGSSASSVSSATSSAASSSRNDGNGGESGMSGVVGGLMALAFQALV